MGACVEVSRGTAYGLSFSQMALIAGSVLFFPGVQVQVFSPEVGIVNGTLPGDGKLGTQAVHVLLGGPLLLLGALTVWFSVMTMTLHEKGALCSDYTHDSLSGVAFWEGT